MLYLKMHFLNKKGGVGLKWTWRCWPCSWIIDATCIGRIVWWSFVLLNFTYSSLCMYLQLKKKINNPCFAFYWRVPRTAYLLLSSVLSMCILGLYFVLKENMEKNPLLFSMLELSPLVFFSFSSFFLFLEYIKQLILLYLIFFCKLIGFV